MKKKDLQILAKFSNKYIAYTNSRLDVLASGSTIKEVEKELESQKIKEATIAFIPPIDQAFSPICQ